MTKRMLLLEELSPDDQVSRLVFRLLNPVLTKYAKELQPPVVATGIGEAIKYIKADPKAEWFVLTNHGHTRNKFLDPDAGLDAAELDYVGRHLARWVRRNAATISAYVVLWTSAHLEPEEIQQLKLESDLFLERGRDFAGAVQKVAESLEAFMQGTLRPA